MKRIFHIILVIFVLALLVCSNKTIDQNNAEMKLQIEKFNSHVQLLKSSNTELRNENSTLKMKIDQFHSPKENPMRIPTDWKIYRYLEYGYEVAYPEDYSPIISGGHSVAANPVFEMRLSLLPKDKLPLVDIDSVTIDTFQSVDNFIKISFKGEMLIDSSLSVNNVNYGIYKLKDDNYYFVFFANKSHIFQMSSSSKEFLKEIARTFKFI